MNDAKEWKEIFRRLLTEKLAQGEAADAGSEFEQIVQLLLSHAEEHTHYNRVLGSDEKQVITNDAFGYLLQLHSLGTIDRSTFEKIINLCLHLTVFVQRRIDRPLIEQIVNLVLFSADADVSMKEIVEFFLKGELPDKPTGAH